MSAPEPFAAALDRIRSICAELPGNSERLSHGSPAFFAGGRQYLTILDGHHGDGRLAIWCAAAPLVQETLVEADSEVFFRPPYVGVRGWLGVRLDRGLSWNDVAKIVRDAHAAISGSRARGG